MIPTAQQLHDFATQYAKANRGDDPTVRIASRFFRCSQQEIRNVAESGDPIEAPGEGLSLTVAFRNGNGVYKISNPASYQIEAY